MTLFLFSCTLPPLPEENFCDVPVADCVVERDVVTETEDDVRRIQFDEGFVQTDYGWVKSHELWVGAPDRTPQGGFIRWFDGRQRKTIWDNYEGIEPVEDLVEAVGKLGWDGLPEVKCTYTRERQRPA